MRLPLQDIHPNPTNPRIIKDDKFKKLVQSLANFPEMAEVRELVLNKDHVILGGNMRYKAMQEAGWKDAPVQIVDWTPEQQREFIIKDNVAGGEWDWDALANDWDSELLDDWGLDLPASFGDDEVEEDEAPEVSSEPAVSQLGEVYQLGRHRLMCGDSTDAAQVRELMDGVQADLVFTDPPYGVDYDGGHATKKRRDKLMGDENVDLYEPCCRMAFEFSASNAPLYLWHAGVKGISAAAAAMYAGYEIRSEIIWNKNQAQFGAISAQYKQKHEPCYYCFKKGQSARWNGPNNETTVWDMDRAQRNDMHPTQKPVGLAARAISNHDCVHVLDLFGGSGSTLIACEQLDRTCYMMELDPKYADVIRKRYAKFIGQEDWQEATPIITG